MVSALKPAARKTAHQGVGVKDLMPDAPWTQQVHDVGVSERTSPPAPLPLASQPSEHPPVEPAVQSAALSVLPPSSPTPSSAASSSPMPPVPASQDPRPTLAKPRSVDSEEPGPEESVAVKSRGTRFMEAPRPETDSSDSDNVDNAQTRLESTQLLLERERGKSARLRQELDQAQAWGWAGCPEDELTDLQRQVSELMKENSRLALIAQGGPRSSRRSTKVSEQPKSTSSRLRSALAGKSTTFAKLPTDDTESDTVSDDPLFTGRDAGASALLSRSSTRTEMDLTMARSQGVSRTFSRRSSMSTSRLSPQDRFASAVEVLERATQEYAEILSEGRRDSAPPSDGVELHLRRIQELEQEVAQKKASDLLVQGQRQRITKLEQDLEEQTRLTKAAQESLQRALQRIEELEEAEQAEPFDFLGSEALSTFRRAPETPLSAAFQPSVDQDEIMSGDSSRLRASIENAPDDIPTWSSPDNQHRTSQAEMARSALETRNPQMKKRNTVSSFTFRRPDDSSESDADDVWDPVHLRNVVTALHPKYATNGRLEWENNNVLDFLDAFYNKNNLLPPKKIPQVVFFNMYNQVKMDHSTTHLAGLDQDETLDYTRQVQDLFFNKLSGEMQEQRRKSIFTS